MGITWKDRVRDEAVRAQTKSENVDLVIKERRLRCLVISEGRMLTDCRDKLYTGTWTLEDLGKTEMTRYAGLTCKEAQQLPTGKNKCRSVAHCVFDTGCKLRSIDLRYKENF